MQMKLIVALLATISGITIGCGTSGRDLSDGQWLELQRKMQLERAEVGQQRDQLETDRREWDQRERHEPVVAAVISSAALLLVCGLPLLLVAILLWPRHDPSADEAVCSVLIDEVVLQTTSSTKRLPTPSDPTKLASVSSDSG